MKFPRSIRRVIMLAVLPVLLMLSVPAAAFASSGSATSTGWIRLAHLSPNTPAVDVYLYSFGNPSAQIVLHHVSYGTVSPYEQVAAGDYSVAMRAAGAAASSKPVLSTSVDVAAGHAYTVAGMGPESGLRLQVLDDDLTAPPGEALVRVIQASLREHVVSVSCGGQTLSSSLSFASVTSYQTVSPGTETVSVSGGGESANASLTVEADSVYTVVVLDGANGLIIDPLEDAAGSTIMPGGGAATGFGGTAPHSPMSPLPWLAVIAAGTLLAAGGGLRLRRVSRSC
jgi:hypothetical protein